MHPADGINQIESPTYFAAMNSELGGKYLNDSRNNINWSLDYTDFTKSFFKNIIRDHESEGVDFWWLDWQQYLTSPYTNSLSETFGAIMSSSMKQPSVQVIALLSSIVGEV